MTKFKQFFASGIGTGILILVGAAHMATGVIFAGTMFLSYALLSVGGFLLGLPISRWAGAKLDAQRRRATPGALKRYLRRKAFALVLTALGITFTILAFTISPAFGGIGGVLLATGVIRLFSRKDPYTLGW